MSYLRFSSSDWYVYETYDNTLAVHSRFGGGVVLSVSEVESLLTSESDPFEIVPGFYKCAQCSQHELILALYQFLRDERHEPSDVYERHMKTLRRIDLEAELPALEDIVARKREDLKKLVDNEN